MPLGFSVDDILTGSGEADIADEDQQAPSTHLCPKEEDPPSSSPPPPSDSNWNKCSSSPETIVAQKFLADEGEGSGNLPSASANAITQWAAQCLRQVLWAAGGDCGVMEQQNGGGAQNYHPLILQTPLALTAGTGFPLFQHMQKSKRVRTAFSPAQLVQLEQAFRRSQYLVGSERKQLAKQLMLSETQVKVWFQNRRTKSKRFMDDETTPIEEEKNCGHKIL